MCSFICLEYKISSPKPYLQVSCFRNDILKQFSLASLLGQTKPAWVRLRTKSESQLLARANKWKVRKNI